MDRRIASLSIVSFLAVVLFVDSAPGALVGHWTFDNASSTSTLLADTSTSGSNNSGTFNSGTTPAGNTGVLGGALELFGSQNIDAGSSVDFDDTSFTVSAWLYNDPGVASWRTAFGHWATTQNIHYGRNNTGAFGDFGGGQTSGGSMTDATWYHVVSRRGASGPENSLWINGVKQAQTSTGTTTALGANLMYIGTKDGSNGNPWDGRIDDLGYFSEPLTDGQIVATYDMALSSYAYDLGEMQQLFDVHDLGSGLATVDGVRWAFSSGLGATEGLITFAGSPAIVLDGTLGTGLIFAGAIPEPTTFTLTMAGLIGLSLVRNRRQSMNAGVRHNSTRKAFVAAFAMTLLPLAASHAAIIAEYRFESGNRLTDSASGGSVSDTLSVIGAAVSYEAGIPGLATGGNNDDAVRLTRSSRLQAADSADLDISNTWTLEMFINPDDTTGAFQRLMTKWFGATTEYHFAINNNGMDLFANGVATSINDEGSPLAIGDWSYLAVTNNSANGVDGLKGYINGSLVSTGSGITITPGTSPLDLGYNDLGNGFAGLLDEIRIHNTEQSFAYIQGRANLLNVIPEPSTALLVGLGFSTLMFRRRRSSRVQS